MVVYSTLNLIFKNLDDVQITVPFGNNNTYFA